MRIEARVSREELLCFEKYKRLETEGAFADQREQHLLSALCWLYVLYLSSKGGNAEELSMAAATPEIVCMRMPNEDDLKKHAEKKVKKERQSYRGLIAIAKGKGVKVKTVSKQEFFKDFYNE